MKLLLVILSIALLGVSCSPQKRLAGLLRRHPELITNTIDTIHIDSLLTIPGKEASLKVPWNFNDTMYRIQSGIEFKIWKEENQNSEDSLVIGVVIPEDTLRFLAAVPYVSSRVEASNKINYNLVIIVIALFLLIIGLIIIIMIFRKLLN